MDNIMEWLCKFAYDHKIEVTLDGVHFKSNVPSTCLGSHVVINMNWDNRQEIPFIFAHEIGHVLNGDGGVMYYCSATSQTKIESAANEQAIDIILRYSNDIGETPNDYMSFMQNYGLPDYLEDKVRRHFNKI